MPAFGLPYLSLIFLAGMIGSFHCIGMCGGFACALGPSPSGRIATLFRHLAYNGARATTYVFLGAIAGSAGAGLTALGDADVAIIWQRMLAVAAGLAMVLLATQLLAPGARGGVLLPGFAAGTYVGGLQALLRSSGPGAPLALGVFNGFLPCPLVYAFLALALASGSTGSGALIMAAFGLGTFPAMLLTGAVGHWVRQAWRRDGVRIAGVLILVLGLITLARGLLPLDGHGAHLHIPALDPPAAQALDGPASGQHHHHHHHPDGDR
jgi:uncharacterized protein